MGGLRDDTGSHNAKDVFGMGFGLDQTRIGTPTTDGVYQIKLGKTSRQLGDKVQTEYSDVLGDPQLAHFLDRRNKDNFAEPEKKGMWARIKEKANERAQLMKQKSLENALVKQLRNQSPNKNSSHIPVTTQAPATFLDRPRLVSNFVMPKKLMFASKASPTTTEDYLASQLR